jgi:hypothetical protein
MAKRKPKQLDLLKDRVKLPPQIRDFKYDPYDIDPRELKKDDSYQRAYVDEARALKMAANYNPDAFGAIVVGLRDDGSFYVVDGWHRTLVALLLDRDVVPCLVFKSTGPAHEAAVFKLLNKDRKAVTPVDVFLAELVAGDPVVVEMAGIIKANGFEVSHVPHPKNLRAVGAMRSIHRAGYLKEVLTDVHLFDSMDPEMVSTSRTGMFMTFLGSLHNPALWTGELREKRVLTLLKRMTIQRWHAACDSVQRAPGGGASRGRLIAINWVERNYNARLSQENRVYASR